MAKGNIKRRLSFFDSHHVIERHTIVLVASVSILATSFVYSHIHLNGEIQQQLMTVNTAGTVTTFSQSTNTSITLGSTTLSSDGKIAYIPMTFSSFANVGVDATNYRIMIGDAGGSTMPYRVNGRFIIFPNSSRAVLVLTSTQPIQNEPLSLFIVNNQKLPSANAGTNNDSEANQVQSGGAGATSFGKYDVAPFKINPGASNVTKAARTDVNNSDIQTLYSQLFGKSDLVKWQKKIKAKQANIQSNMATVAKYRTRLESLGYTVPANPKFLDSDWFAPQGINLDTGKSADGHNSHSAGYASGTLAGGIKPPKFASSLKNKDGSTTSSQQNVGAAHGINAGSQWNDLVTLWQSIYADKLAIQLTYNANIYNIKTSSGNATQNYTMSTSKDFTILNK